MVVGATMGLVLLVSGGIASVFVLGSLLYYRYFDRLANDGGSERVRRVLRNGVALGGILVGVGIVGTAVDATATVAGLDQGFGPPPGPVERALLAMPTGWLPWLMAAGFLLVVASGVVASAEQIRARYLD